MSTRSRSRMPPTPAALEQEYRATYARLGGHLLTTWQRVGVGLSLLLQEGLLPAGGHSSARVIHALLAHRTNTFDGVLEVNRRCITGDVLGVLAVSDSRARRRHNSIISNLGMAKVRGRDVLPSEGARAKDVHARSELRRLARMLPHGVTDGLAVPTAPVRLVDENADMVVQLLPGVRPVRPSLGPEPDDDDTFEELAEVEEVEPQTGLNRTQTDKTSGLEETVDVVEVAELPEPEPEPEPERIPPTTEDILADILAQGRTPNPAELSELPSYLLWLKGRESGAQSR